MKFSIRDLLFVTVIVALVMGWWLDRSRLASKLAEAESSAATAWHHLGHSKSP